MRVLLDTNVVLDFLLDRDPFSNSAAALWKASQEGKVEAYISVITPVNVFYIAKKLKGVTAARQSVLSLLAACRVCAPSHEAMLSALCLPLKDYEDAVQVVSAQIEQLDALVTRDPNDFTGITLLVLSPAALLARLPGNPL